MTAEIKVLEAGLFSTIQDAGRFGLMKYGVPVSGPMDSYAAKLVNLLLKNTGSEAVLEITQTGPRLQFSAASTIAITGATLSPVLSGKTVENNQIITVGPGDILEFGKRQTGCRAYLGIKGGFQTEKLLGSRSWFEGISSYQRLEKGMVLAFEPHSGERPASHVVIRPDAYLSTGQVECLPGPEFSRLSKEVKTRLATLSFHIGRNNNRMGIQLGELVENSLQPIITGPVIPGTVQLTPGGNLIVIMKDGQTTGGYPRVLQLTERGMNTIAQKVPGEEVHLVLREI